MRKLLTTLLILSLLMVCVVPCYSQGGRDYQARKLTVSLWIDLSGRIYNRIIIPFVDGDTTPTVYSSNTFKTANTAPTTITMFDNGILGQRIVIVFGDSNTTIDFSGTNILGNAGIDWTAAQNDVLTAIFDGTNWYTEILSGGVVSSLLLPDTDASNTLELKWNENDSSDRILNFLVGGGDRSFTLNENFTIGNGFDFTLTAEDVAGSILLDNTTVEFENGFATQRLFKLIQGTDAVATLTVEGSSGIVNQDTTTDGSPAFDSLTIGAGTKHDGYIIRDAAEVQTTDATADVTLDTLVLEDENGYLVTARVIARQSDGTTGIYFITVGAERVSAGSAALVGSVVSINTAEDEATWACTFTVSGNNLLLSVTGEAVTTIEWGGTMSYINMSD